MLITKFKKLALALTTLLFVEGLWVPTAFAADEGLWLPTAFAADEGLWLPTAFAADEGLWLPTFFAADIEPLHGVNMTETGLTILVTSTGCTKKEDFVSVLQKSQPPVVTFIRLKPDLCEAGSHPYTIQFSFEEIGAKEFRVSNLFVPAPRFCCAIVDY